MKAKKESGEGQKGNERQRASGGNERGNKRE